MVCPLKLIDAQTQTQLEALPEWTPDRTRITLEPPVLPAVAVELDDSSAHISATDAQRLLRLPWVAGTISGRIADLGDVHLSVDDGHCGLMVVLVAPQGPPAGLSCPLSTALDLDLMAGHKLIRADGPFEGRSLDSRIARGALMLLDAPEAGDAWLLTRHHPPILVSWEQDHCDPIDTPELATLSVEVIGGNASSPVWVKGCGLTERLAPEETQVELTVAAVPCAVEAWRLDGALRALSPLETVDPLPGSTTHLELVLPETETGGIGITFATGEEAVLVRGVRPDSPAWEEGLREGDHIVAIDGEPTGGLQQHDFIALGTGPVGSDVVLLVQAEDGGLDELVIERAALLGR